MNRETQQYRDREIVILTTTGATTERFNITYNFGVHVFVDREEIWAKGIDSARKIKSVKRKGIRQAKALVRSMA